MCSNTSKICSGINHHPHHKEVGYSSGSFTIEITSNVNWTVSSGESWLTCSLESGSNNGTVTVNYTENTGTNERSGTITITGSGITRTCTITQAENPFGTVIDIDGNVYKTVKIGDQWWMAENLKVTKYRNGDQIPYLSDHYQWSINTGAFSYYNYNNNNSIYGALYNWYAVSDQRGLAPEGWRVPNDDDWKTLEKFLGMSDNQVNSTSWRGSDEGKKLKSISGWYDNGNGTNDVGFNSLPAGYYDYDYIPFAGLGYKTRYWSSSNYIGPTAWYRYLSFDQNNIYRGVSSSRSGYSVRCIKD